MAGLGGLAGAGKKRAGKRLGWPRGRAWRHLAYLFWLSRRWPIWRAAVPFMGLGPVLLAGLSEGWHAGWGVLLAAACRHRRYCGQLCKIRTIRIGWLAWFDRGLAGLAVWRVPYRDWLE